MLCNLVPRLLCFVGEYHSSSRRSNRLTQEPSAVAVHHRRRCYAGPPPSRMSADFTALSQSSSLARPSFEEAASRGRGESTPNDAAANGPPSAPSTRRNNDSSTDNSSDSNGMPMDPQNGQRDRRQAKEHTADKFEG